MRLPSGMSGSDRLQPMFLTVKQQRSLALVSRAKGRTTRSNYTAEGPDLWGDWQMHWRALDSLVALGLVIRVGRHYALLHVEAA